MPQRLDPTLDVVFKLLFTRDADSETALLGLVNAVLRPKRPILGVEVLNPAIGRHDLDDKDILLDVRARLADGSTVDLEMQARRHPSFRNRVLYYWARSFGHALSPGGPYTALRPALCVVFLGYVEPENERFHAVFRLLEEHDHTLFSDALALHFVQLPLLGRLTEADRRDDAALLRWGRFLAARTDEEAEATAMDDPAVSKANAILRRLSAEPDARELARVRELAESTRLIYDAGMREEGREEGRLIERRAAVRWLCEVLGVPVDEARSAHLEAMDAEALAALLTELRVNRTWP